MDFILLLYGISFQTSFTILLPYLLINDGSPTTLILRVLVVFEISKRLTFVAMEMGMIGYILVCSWSHEKDVVENQGLQWSQGREN